MERATAASGYDVIVGFDEVGRGSLARPAMGGPPHFFCRKSGFDPT